MELRINRVRINRSRPVIIIAVLSISNERGHFDEPSLSQDFEWKSQLRMALIHQVLTEQSLKKYVMTCSKWL